ncbi:MAG: hypothetical protein LIO93_11400 [Bacteroidales bacterium]|nr:hypothetical protein [Bacteroidales bacterium]
MKTVRFFGLVMILFISMFTTACDDDDADNSTQEEIIFNGNQIGDGTQEFYINGDYTLEKKTYVLKGWIYVTGGSSLTIPAGTIIKGDKDTKAALIVMTGGKIYAEGTASEPIVFTSNQAKGTRKLGDWGGLIVCGKAKNNNGVMAIEGGPNSPHGGNDDDDNSGILSYIRVEFAGYPFLPDQEINGVTFGSVGRGTKIDHIQVSYSNDDSFEWFGGTANAKYLVAYHGWDDDFDTDNGFSGKLQYLLSIRHPRIADTSLSNGFESDNNKDGTNALPNTSCVFSNVTLVGPLGQDPAFANSSEYINGGDLNPNNGSKTGVYQAAMQVRRNSKLNCFNSVAIGYPVGLLLDNEKGDVHGAATAGDLTLNNLYFAGMTVLGSDKNKSWKDAYSADGVEEDLTRESFSSAYFKMQPGNKYYYSISDLLLKQPNSLQANANYGPVLGSPLTGKNANELFSNEKLSSWFDKVDYVGAFRSDSDGDNWLKGWTNFDPQNSDY